MNSKAYKALVAEAIGTFAFVYITIGVIAHFGHVPGDLLSTSPLAPFTFGSIQTLFIDNNGNNR